MTATSAFDANLRTALGRAQYIEISGEDARTFAQTQFSADVRALQPMRWQWNAWLDHKGGVRALMHLADAGDDRLLAFLRGGDAISVSTELGKYKLRARVKIEPVPARFVSLGGALPLHEIHADADALGFGYGEYSLWIENEQRTGDAGCEREWRLREICAGWPRLAAGCEGAFLPPALGLEHLRAVSFEKGCYPGQEIAARLHYRGGHKRRLAHVLGASLLQTAEPLDGGSRDVVIEAVETPDGWHGLAVMDTSSIESNGSMRNIQLIREFEA